MNEPRWVTEEAAKAIHQMQLADYGGASGIRDLGLFESAMNRPKNVFAYADPPPSIFEMAAAYAFGLAKNHPFVDGNKRTALVVCLTFLRLNGFTIMASPESRYLTFYALASGEVSESELAVWLKQNSANISSSL